MANEKEGQLRYHVLSEAWYASANLRPGDNVVERINFGRYALEGGCYWEAQFSWHHLGGQDCPRLEVFGDAWQAPELERIVVGLRDLADVPSRRWLTRKDVRGTPAAVRKLLEGLGFVDATARQDPGRNL